MATLDKMPRTRRRRTAVSLGGIIVLIGLTFVTGMASAGEFTHPLMVGSVVGTALGVGLLLWGRRGRASAETTDQQTLVHEGHWDRLPAGTYEEGGRIGLPSQALWTNLLLPLFGGLMLLVGGFMALGSLVFEPSVDTGMLLGGSFVVLLGLLMFGVLFLTAGTPYWLDVEGVSHPRWPRSHIAWTDVSGMHVHQNRLLLHRRQPRRRDFVISAGVLQISFPALVELVETLRHQAAGPLPSDPTRDSGKIEG